MWFHKLRDDKVSKKKCGVMVVLTVVVSVHMCANRDREIDEIVGLPQRTL